MFPPKSYSLCVWLRHPAKKCFMMWAGPNPKTHSIESIHSRSHLDIPSILNLWWDRLFFHVLPQKFNPAYQTTFRFPQQQHDSLGQTILVLACSWEGVSESIWCWPTTSHHSTNKLVTVYNQILYIHIYTLGGLAHDLVLKPKCIKMYHHIPNYTPSSCHEQKSPWLSL